MTDLPLVELVTRDLDGTCELVTAVRVAGGPVLEVPEGSRVAVEYLAGSSLATVHVELLAARVRHVSREALAEAERPEPTDLAELRSLTAHHRPHDDLCAACSGRWPCVTARLLAEVDRRGRHVHELSQVALDLQAELTSAYTTDPHDHAQQLAHLVAEWGHLGTVRAVLADLLRDRALAVLDAAAREPTPAEDAAPSAPPPEDGASPAPRG